MRLNLKIHEFINLLAVRCFDLCFLLLREIPYSNKVIFNILSIQDKHLKLAFLFLLCYYLSLFYLFLFTNIKGYNKKEVSDS